MKIHTNPGVVGRYLLFLTSVFGGLLFAAAMPATLRGQDARDQESTKKQALDKERPARENWRKEMVRRPLPRNGCFKANYPETEWREVKCVAPPTVHYPPQERGKRGQFTVGNGTDWSAQSMGTISSAEGSFLSVNGGASVTAFSLQVNSMPSNTNACNGGNAGCQGWAQFILSQAGVPTSCAGTPCIFIEYWLLGYGFSCPGAPWQSDGGGSCVFNTPAMLVGSPITAADLPNLTLTGTANAGGQDVVTLGTSGGSLTAVGQDSAVFLSANWSVAEFNVFGDSSLHPDATFSNPTTIDVKTTINDGTTNPPTCLPQGFTGETNNLNLADVTNSNTLVCCPYGGTSPSIEFMETNAGHTAVCGPTQIEGDPHITTADGTHYDFQAAGEFVSLREATGMEIQTRQAPIATTFFPGPDAHDDLATCVSLNSAVAARVGKHRVSYEPDLSGVPNPNGLQLRIDGVLTNLPPQGIDLGDGGRVVPQALPGALEIDFPEGRTLFVTPEWWASQAKWYLNVDVTHLGIVNIDGGGSSRTALGGIAGPIASGSWLPALPNGSSVGAMPSSTQDRYDTLYKKFADAWRVTDRESLFDYAPGTSTSAFTMREWPTRQPPCRVPETKPVPPLREEVAAAACRRVFDPKRHADCVFDVRVAGDVSFAKLYLDTLRIVTDSTSISLKDDPDPSQVGEFVEFTAFVAANSTHPVSVPSGTVQFTVDGTLAGAPVPVDAKGRASYGISRLRVGKHRVSAAYLPAADTSFLPSTSVQITHVVKRCHCDKDHGYGDQSGLNSDSPNSQIGASLQPPGY